MSARFIESAELWSGLDIPVIGGTGEKGVGKTLFGLTIDPYDESGQYNSVGKTLVYDFEGSSITHRRLICPDCYFDCAKELIRSKGRGYTAKDRFEWFRASVSERIKDGGVSVVMIDPVSELEEGLAMWVESNPGRVGYTAQQFKKSTALMMGAIKSYQKKFLDDIRTYIGTLYFVAHQRLQFKGGTPTGKREAKGKETLFELASLYIKFDRTPYRDEAGSLIVPTAPFGTVMKTRLNHTKFVNGELVPVPILPPRIPGCTPKKIREYIATPADFSHLKSEEIAREESLSEDDKLLLRAATADAERAASEANLAIELEKTARKSRNTVAHSPPPADKVHEINADTEVVMPPTELQKEKVRGFVELLGAEAVGSIAKKVHCPKDGSYEQYQALIDELQLAKNDRMKEDLDQMPPTVGRAGEPEAATQEQFAKLKDLTRFHTKQDIESLAQTMFKAAVKRLNFEQCSRLICALQWGYETNDWSEKAAKLLEQVSPEKREAIKEHMEMEFGGVDLHFITEEKSYNELINMINSQEEGGSLDNNTPF